MSDLDPLVPTLREIGGEHPGRVHRLALGEQVIGRDSEASIRLTHPDISREHAKLTVELDGVSIADLGSKNGVFVDGKPIEGGHRLTHGQRFELGGLELQLEHPAGRVQDALRAAGEPTLTRTHVQTAETRRRPSLVWPILAVVVFGGLAVALFVFG